MLLLVDVGNTQTTIGVHSGNEGDGSYRAMWRISTDKVATSDDIRAQLQPLFQIAGISVSDVRRAAVASVVPFLSISWSHAVEKTWGVKPVCCSAAVAHECGLFDADYPAPDEIGSDRVADAIAARAFFGDPVVVVDFGTATNIEVIDRDGRFRGGVIAPGVQTSANALFTHGAQLPDIALVAPPAVIGTNTVEAIQSGIMLGEADRVDGLVRRIFDQLGYPAKVIATGGLAPVVERYSSTIDEVNTELTLEGLRLIADRAYR